MEKKYLAALAEMPNWCALAVGVALVERMRPNYQLFCDALACGDPARFEAILRLLWDHAAGLGQRVDFERQQQKLVLITPDCEAFTAYGVYPAADACAGLEQLLAMAIEPEHETLQPILALSRSTIEQFLAVSGSEEALESHPLFLREQAYLAELLDLSGSALPRRARVAAIREYAQADACSNIGIALE